MMLPLANKIQSVVAKAGKNLMAIDLKYDRATDEFKMKVLIDGDKDRPILFGTLIHVDGGFINETWTPVNESEGKDASDVAFDLYDNA